MNTHLKYRFTLLLGVVLLLLGNSLYAKHIIGGEITYTCNGNGSYTFDMYIYRDCSRNDGAPFDNPAVITVYLGNGSPFDQIIAQVGGAHIVNQGLVDPPVNPCLEVPENVCVQQAYYQFTVNDLDDFFDPANPESFHIVYQRCCRNNTIANINNPQSSGATYTMEITPQAYELCNNSPVFNDFPPTVICVNEPLVFDHSATDPDGDQMVYEFCAPLLGGGLAGSQGNPGSATACNGVSPTPACAPPFSPVSFQLPTFSATQPLAGNPVVQIDPNTGLITGTPEIIGQFVVGVCVKEYRGGQLLSVLRRDFQFNVTDCTPLVDARIQNDEVIGVKEYVVNSCGNNTVTFINQSVQQQNIDEQFWRFMINGVEEEYTSWDAMVTFPDTGTYMGTLILNPNNQECSDTATIYVNIYPEINADFSFSYDTCVAGPVSFVDGSHSEGGPILEWLWNFGDGNNSDEINPDHLFDDPGNHIVSLTVIDGNECEDTYSQTINWYPAPPIIIIEPSVFDGCAPQHVFFNNLSSPIDSTYTILWNFGDGTTGTDISPTHLYENVGVYDISLEITSPIGCFISDSWSNWINVRPAPTAGFIYSPDRPSNFQPEVSFTDQSIDAIQWEWLFDSDGTSFQQNPVFAFPDTGLQMVYQIVTHASGCTDTATALIDVEPQVRYFVPNAFSPNNDDINDTFRGAGIFDGMEAFHMTIWNRWGELVFETNDPSEGWNGKKLNTGDMSPLGVYVYAIQFIGPRNKPVFLKGFATLVK